MMTNPAAAMRMLITYAICIPVAIFVGYLLTNPLDYGTLGFLGFVLLLLIVPLLIKFHYEMLLFGLGAPIVLFFLYTRPPLSQAVVVVSLGIAIVERTLSSERRFLSVRSITWPLLFILGVTILTMELTGGLGLHSFGSSGGGGKKYIVLFIGIATYFALTSRPFPPERRKLYLALFFLAGLPAFVGDLFPFLPSPLNYINLLVPPTLDINANPNAISRFGSFATTAGVLVTFMLVKWGLRGIFMGGRPWRVPVFMLLLVLTLIGGFRSSAIGYAGILLMMFFIEGLHRTRLLLVFLLGGLLAGGLLVPVAGKLPLNIQRSLAFLPLNWDSTAVIQADQSTEWRQRIWRDLWPKVPDYLLLGKGYSMTAADYESIGSGTFAEGFEERLEASRDALAISSDYHNGPLSTLIPFGAWGAIGFLWLAVAGFRVLYRNWKFSPPELRTVNAFLLAFYVQRLFSFLFVVGAFQEDVGGLAKILGFSIALNGGLLGPKPEPVTAARLKPLAQPLAA